MKNVNLKSIVLVISVGLLVSGCDMKTGKNRPGQEKSSATFYLDTFGGQSQVAAIEPIFEYPQSKLYNFEACLNDMSHRKRIANHKFEISGAMGSQRSVESTTDERGCLRWTEEIPYNFFSDSAYLSMYRTLRSTGVHKGQIEVNFALNPWSHGESLSEVVDLSKKEVADLLDYEVSGQHLMGLSENSKDGRSLWFSGFNVDFKESTVKPDSMILEAELTSQPQVLVKDTKDKYVAVGLPGGKYRIKVFLIHELIENGESTLRVLNEPLSFTGQAQRGQLTSKFKLEIRAIPTRGRYKVGLIVEPIEGPKGLRNFEGLFDFGSVSYLTGSRSGRLLNEVAELQGEYQLSDSLQVQTFRVGPSTPGYKKPGYEVRYPVSVRFVKYGQESNSEREVILNITACIIDSSGGKVEREPFTVHKMKLDRAGQRTQASRTTGNDGCMTWQDAFKHNYFIKERNFLKTFVVENTDMNLNEEVPVLINPWDFGFTFGRDARALEESEINDLSFQSRPESEFFLTSFTYKYIGTRYEIDDLLNLRVIEKLRLRLNPKTTRYSSQTRGREAVDDLRPGLYLIRVALRRNEFEQPEEAGKYIAGLEKIVEVTKGRLIADIEIPFRDIRLQGSRNDLLIELSLIDESKVQKHGEGVYLPKTGETIDSVVDLDSGLMPKTFIGPLVMYNDSGGAEMLDVDSGNYMGSSSPRAWLNPYHSLSNEERALEILQALPEKIENTKDFIRWGRAMEQLEYRRQYRDKYIFSEVNHLDHIELSNSQSIKNFEDKYNNLRSVSPLFAASRMNTDANAGEAVTKELQTVLKGGAVSSSLAVKLCSLWYMEFFKRDSKMRGRNVSTAQLLTECRNRARSFPNQYFMVDRRIEVDDIEMLEYMGGRHFNLSTGASFSLNRGFGETTYTGASASLNYGIEKIFGLGVGAMFSLSAGHRTSWSSGYSNSMSAGAGISLTVEENTFRLKFKRFKKCAVIRLHPKSVSNKDGFLKRFFDHLFNTIDTLKEPPRTLPSQYGLYVCGKEEAQPVEKLEKYYYITQGLGAGYQQDRNDWRNRPFMVALRGERDFYTFLTFMNANLDVPKSSWIDSDNSGHLLRRLENTFEAIPPTHPGLYTDF